MRIQIIGGSGTGKSSLAKYMSENEAIKWIDMDAFLWKNHSFTENNSIERRQELYQMEKSQSPVLKMAVLNHWKSCIVKFWSN